MAESERATVPFTTVCIHFVSRMLKRVYFFPRTRFWLFYHIDSVLNSKAAEWSFVLDFLPPVPRNTKKVLDVGASESLLLYELNARGYHAFGLDQRPFQERLRPEVGFILGDITQEMPGYRETFDYITIVSTFEHIGLGEYGDRVLSQGQELALAHMWQMLKPDGLVLMTVPTSYGFSYEKVRAMAGDLFSAGKMETRMEQVCAVLHKKQVRNAAKEPR